MSKTIVVSRGLCSAMREDVLTATKTYGVRIIKFECRGWGRHPFPNRFFALPIWIPVPDDDIWAKRHVARITVSDDQQRWAERLLWQSNRVKLDSKPHPDNVNLKWNAPPDCKAGPQGTLGRGHMPTPWSAKQHQPRPPKKAAAPAQRNQSRLGSILGFLRRF